MEGGLFIVERGKHGRFHPYGKTYGQVFQDQE
jgi:hypothetical protein